MPHHYLTTVASVDENNTVLKTQDGQDIRLPTRSFYTRPTVGQTLRLLAVPQTDTKPLPPALARELLNELLLPVT